MSLLRLILVWPAAWRFARLAKRFAIRCRTPNAAAPVAAPPANAPSKSDAGATRTGQPAAPDDFDPEVGF
jgi:hypothetical protein